MIDAVIDFLYNILEWFTFGLYDFVVSAIAWIIKQLTIFWLETKLWALKFCWSVAQEFLNQVDFSHHVNQAFGALPSGTRQVIAFFRLPEGINIVMSAAVTRYVMSFLGV